MTEPDDTADSGLDIEKTADAIGAELFPSAEEPETEIEAAEVEEEAEPAAEEPEPEKEPTAAAAEGVAAAPSKEGADPATAAATPREMPKSWAKDKQAIWDKLAPEAQDYYTVREQQFLEGIEQYKADAGLTKQLREIIQPYRPMLQAQGISDGEAIQYLLNAQYRLTSGTPEERRAALLDIARRVGLEPQPTADPNAPPDDPRLTALQKQVEQLTSAQTQKQQADLRAAKADADKAVIAFEQDPKNVHFKDVALDMVQYIRAGLDLPSAYDKAVWANPITRAKEQARLQTEANAAREKKAREEGEAAKRATSVNIRGKPSRTTPTEPKGKFLDEESMREDLKAIRTRTH